MNFLAHLYLSNNNPSLLIGNFIADHVKGKKILQFDTKIQQGIELHRAIDNFTDTHPIVKRSKQRLDKRYRHYNGVIIDIFYDYFLAKNWQQYSAIPLEIYTDSIYTFFTKITTTLPIQSQNFIAYMQTHNILFNYQYIKGIEKVLQGMNARTNGKSQMHLAINDLLKFEADFEKDFTLFFKELIQFTRLELNTILAQQTQK